MNVDELQRIVEKEGLEVVAERIGYAKSAVCHVVRGTYKGRPDRILIAAEEKYSQENVECPVLGDITLSRCVEERHRPFAAVNPIRVRLARTCPKCTRGQHV
jgi:hypothetical protein